MGRVVYGGWNGGGAPTLSVFVVRQSRLRLIFLLLACAYFLCVEVEGLASSGHGRGARGREEGLGRERVAQLRSGLGLGRRDLRLLLELSKKKPGARSMILGITPIITVKNLTLCPTGTADILVAHTAKSPFDLPFEGTVACVSYAGRLVVSPNDSILYYRLQEACIDTMAKLPTKMRFSFWKANLNSSPAQAGVNTSPGGVLLSYWWVAANASGAAALDPIVTTPLNTTLAQMAYVMGGMDLTKSGTHLVMGSRPIPTPGSMLTFLDTRSGQRVAFRAKADNLGSVAFDPTKSHLFVSDDNEPYRILSATMLAGDNDVEVPMDATTTFETVATFPRGGVPNITSTVFGPQSMDPSGTCVYFADVNNYILWSIDLLSPSSKVTRVAGSGTSEQATDGEALSASFTSVGEPVVTPDGCNVFVADNDRLRWITLESPCSRAIAVSTIAVISASSFQSMALHDNGNGLTLFFGTFDDIRKLDLNRSALHDCSKLSSKNSTPISISPESSLPPPLPSQYYGNPTPPSSTATASAVSERAGKSGLHPVVIIVPVVSGFILVLIAVVVLFLVCKPPRNGQAPSSSAALLTSTPPMCTDDNGLSALHPVAVRLFKLEDLRSCTNGFDPGFLVGEKGAFGAVYWGALQDRDVAIKVMDGELTATKRRQFVAEVNTLSRLHHANLVELIGYCDEGNRLILVYPFFRGGSLHSRLHYRSAMRGTPLLPPLTLAERMSIASQIAEGLRYLHYGANPRVIHRDIKSCNVLLGDGFGETLRVVVADFGLAAFSANVFQVGEESAVRTLQIAGTRGYMAPEYVMRGRLTVKSDVYAFGVLLLELLTGKPAIVSQGGPEGECQALVSLMRAFSDQPNVLEILGTIVDYSLRQDVQESVAIRNVVMDTIWLGISCSQDDDEKRPTMSSACETLANIMMDLKKPRS